MLLHLSSYLDVEMLHCEEGDARNREAELCLSVSVVPFLSLFGLGPTRGQHLLYFCFLSDSGSIVSVGDPKKKYTRFEKIGQG